MTKKKAKKVLASQKAKLNLSYQLGDFIWLHATRHYIEHLFTKDSEAYTLLASFRPIDLNDPLYAEIVGKLNRMVDEWIEMVDSGTYTRPPKPNFFRHIPDAHLIWLLPLIITALVSLGIEWGSRLTDNKVVKADDTIKQLKDSITNLHLSILRHTNDSNRLNGDSGRPTN